MISHPVSSWKKDKMPAGGTIPDFVSCKSVRLYGAYHNTQASPYTIRFN
jgi:hypothetical protein